MCRAQRSDLAAGAKENSALPERLHHARFEQRRVDQLSLAGSQSVHVRADDPERRKNSRIDVGDWRSDLGWRTARFPGDAHQSRQALRNEIEAALVGVWSRKPVTGHGTINQRGIALPP